MSVHAILRGFLVGHVKDVHSLGGQHASAFPLGVENASHPRVVNFWEGQGLADGVLGLLSILRWSNWASVSHKIYVVGPEFAVTSRLDVRLWVGGTQVKADFVAELCVKFLSPCIVCI